MDAEMFKKTFFLSSFAGNFLPDSDSVILQDTENVYKPKFPGFQALVTRLLVPAASGETTWQITLVLLSTEDGEQALTPDTDLASVMHSILRARRGMVQDLSFSPDIRIWYRKSENKKGIWSDLSEVYRHSGEVEPLYCPKPWRDDIRQLLGREATYSLSTYQALRDENWGRFFREAVENHFEPLAVELLPGPWAF